MANVQGSEKTKFFSFDEVSIVTGVRAEGPEITAAASIRERFAKEAEVDVPVVSEDKMDLFKNNLIVIGTPETCDMLREMKRPKWDGWLIDVEHGRVTLLGGMPRGALYATDQFLDLVKVGLDGFTIEKCSIIEEPSFQKRIIYLNPECFYAGPEFFSSGLEFFLDPNLSDTYVELIRRNRFNTFVIVSSALDSVVLEESFPEVYKSLKEKEKTQAEKWRLKELDKAKKLEEIRNRYGIDYYVRITIGIPGHLHGAVYRIYPDVKGKDNPDSFEKAAICPSNTISWKIWHAVVEEVLEMYPGADGLFLEIMYDGYGIYCQCDKCRDVGLNEFPAEIRKAVLETYEVLKKHDKKLLYHLWTSNSKPRKGRSQGSHTGLPWFLPGDRSEWVFRQVIEWTPPEIEFAKMDTWGDHVPTAPMDPIIGKSGKHPLTVVFQVAGEYRGFNKVPSSMVQYLKDRMSVCAQLGVSGVLVVAGGWVDPYYLFWKDIINGVNFEAFARLAWNVKLPVDEIWGSWTEKIYGSKAAPKVVAALKMSQSVIEKSLAIKGLNFNDHSGYSSSIARTWEVSWDWSNYWYPDSHERFGITPKNIEEVIAEKEDGLKTVREMLSIVDEAKTHLQEQHYNELKERTEWLLHYATIQRYLSEVYFRMLYLEEIAKKGEMDEGQLGKIDRAINGITEAHAKLPKSAKVESYYLKIPEEGRFPAYPAYPWLPAHSSGHPVRLANMMRAVAADLVYESRVWSKSAHN